MDSVIGLDFKNEMPIVITKTIAATVVKGVAAYAANQAANQQSDWAGLLMQIGTACLSGRRQHRRRTHLDDAAKTIPSLPFSHAAGSQN
jgi:hypothetical protein